MVGVTQNGQKGVDVPVLYGKLRFSCYNASHNPNKPNPSFVSSLGLHYEGWWESTLSVDFSVD